MKNSVLQILFMMAFLRIAAAPVVISFPDGTQLSLHKVEMTNEQYDSWKTSENSLKSMFYIYNTPADIEQYKNIFYQSGYPAGIENVYPEWRQKMQGVTFTPQAIFWGTLDQQEVSCIQYYYSQDQLSVQVSFFARRIQGKWYPMSGADNIRYQHVMGLMATLQPELIANLIHPDPASPFSVTTEALRLNCMAGALTITEACLYETGEAWGMSENAVDQQNEMKLFRDRMHQAIPEESQRMVEASLLDYVSTLGLPEVGVKRAMYYFSKKESMKAIAIMRSYGLSLDNATLYQQLNDVQHTAQYRSIEYKPQSVAKPN